MCVCFKSHLTSGASVCPENAANYSAANKGKKIVAFSLKLMRFRDRVPPPLEGPYIRSAIFLLRTHKCIVHTQAPRFNDDDRVQFLLSSSGILALQ